MIKIDKIFASALSVYGTENSEIEKKQNNLFLNNYSSSLISISQIELFNLLSNIVPPVAMPTTIGHNLILDEIAKKEDVTFSIVDIGVGTGQQTLKLLKKLQDLKNIKKVTIVGIEPSADSLQQAEGSFEIESKNFAFEVKFVGFNSLLEDISENLQEIAEIVPNPIIWASFSFHHVKSDRTVELIRLRNILQPSLIVLLEPNVDHFTSVFGDRFFNSYRYFTKIFEVIDKLGLEEGQNSALKEFFSREIYDIVSKNEANRFERHETASSWVSRLQEAGFAMVAPTRSYTNDVIAITNKDTYVSLESQSSSESEAFPLTCVLAAKPNSPI